MTKLSKDLIEAVSKVIKPDEIIQEEILDELDKKTLKSYVKKATTSADRAWAKADKEEDKAMATDGEKYPEKQARHNNAAIDAIKVWRKRDSGLGMAKKKLKEDSDEFVEFDVEQILSVNEDTIEVMFEEGIETFDLEQIDELSKKTLGSYIKKASKNLDDYSHYSGRQFGRAEAGNAETNIELGKKYGKVSAKRVKGIAKATDKLTKEETENLDELSKGTLGNYINKSAADIEKHADKAGRDPFDTNSTKKALKRQRGIATAVRKLTKEDAEDLDEGRGKKGRLKQANKRDHQEDEWGTEKKNHKMKISKPQKSFAEESEIDEETLDEISKKTLGSYIKKAKNDHSDLKTYADNMVTPEFVKKAKRKMNNRSSGIDKAVDKLTKEEVENLDEISKKTLSSYISKASDSAANHAFKQGTADQKAKSATRPAGRATHDMKADNEAEKTNKRLSGIKLAAKKLAKEEVESIDEDTKLSKVKSKLQAIHKKEMDAHEKHMSKLNDNLHSKFHKEAPKILEKHGFKKISDGDESYTYAKPSKSGHVTIVNIGKHNSKHFGTAYSMHSSTGSHSGSHVSHNGLYSAEDHDKHSKEMMPKFESKVIEAHNHTEQGPRF